MLQRKRFSKFKVLHVLIVVDLLRLIIKNITYNALFFSNSIINIFYVCWFKERLYVV